jgi:hypothetical protein
MITASSCKAELNALFQDTKAGIDLQRLCTEMSAPLEYESSVFPLEILQYNQSIVKVTKNFDPYKLQKCVDLRYRCVEDKADCLGSNKWNSLEDLYGLVMISRRLIPNT